MFSSQKLVAHMREWGKPVTADIFLTNFCNNSCPYCTYVRYGDVNAKYVDFEAFKKYASRLVELGVKGMILTGGGEPTVNPDFDKIAGWLTENHIKWGINTNFNVLKYIQPHYLKISLDGWDEESYSQRRGVRAYKKTVENIEAYCKWKEGNGVGTNVGIQMLVTQPEDITKFYYANCMLPVDYIVFRPMESTAGEYYHEVEHCEKAAEAVEIIKDLQKRDTRVKINYKWFELGSYFQGCLANWAQVAVNVDGEVIYCCHKPYEVVCSVMDDDLLAKKAAYETDMSRCDVPCRLTGPNKCVAAICGIKDVEFI